MIPLPPEALQNLLRIGQLDAVPYSPALLEKMLATAKNRLQDALDVAPGNVRVLDALRKQRNLSDYEGDLVTDQALQECLVHAQNLYQIAVQKLTPISP